MIGATKTERSVEPPVSFGALIAPLDPTTFLREYWTRKAVLCRDPNRQFVRFCDWDMVNAALNATDAVSPKIRVSREDAPVRLTDYTKKGAFGNQVLDGRRIMDLFRSGATFSITLADSGWFPIRQLTDCVRDQFGEPVHANVYCAPPDVAGFNLHYDQHEVFALQVEGAKRWRVFTPTVDCPIDGSSPEESAAARDRTPYIDVVLTKGDVLYVPRGHWHYVVAESSVSLHITIGVRCRTGVTFLNWLEQNLSDKVELRRNLPLHCQDPGPWIHSMREVLAAVANDTALFERFLSEARTDSSASFQVNMPAHSFINVDVGRLRFRRPAGRQHVIEDLNDEGVVVKAGGVECKIDTVNADLVRRIFAADEFSLDEIVNADSEADRNAVATLLKELVGQGLLNAD